MTKKKDRNRNGGTNQQSSQAYQRFASTSTVKTGNQSTTSTSSFTESRLKSMLQDPSKNASNIAGLSSSMKNVNGIYKRIVKYMSSILTFDHTLYPVMENPLQFAEDTQALQQAFAQSAIFIDRLSPKFHLPLFTEKLFTKGVTYQYKSEDSKSIAYQEIPTSYCRISYIEDGVYRYQVDITKFSDTTIIYFPKEIQNAYTQYKNGQSDKFEDNKWYQVSDKGVAFTLDSEVLQQLGMSLPPLASSLIDAIKMENAKEQMEDDADLDNTKIVHSQIETDEKGRPLMELNVVQEYHNALKRNLPTGAVAITNPFKTTAMTLSGTGADGKFSLLEKTKDLMYQGAGVSSQLFADDNSSSQALERSIQVDCQWLYSFLLPMYTNYFNYELKKASKKGVAWKIKFLPISYFDKDSAIKTAKDQLSFGGSRLEYLAYCGMTPIEVANMLVFEQRVMSIDDYMIAKSTSYTQSGKDSEEDAGRPPTDSPTDTTTRIKDAE